MRDEPSLGEWLSRPLPGWLKALFWSVSLAGLSFATGLWITHHEPTATPVPGTPTAVSLDGGPSIHDPKFILKILGDLNGKAPYPPNRVSSCFASGPREDTLRFTYPDGDQLTVLVRSGCGNSAVAAYSPAVMAYGSEQLVNDIAFWPASQNP
jgi:hypothetical protein